MLGGMAGTPEPRDRQRAHSVDHAALTEIKPFATAALDAEPHEHAWDDEGDDDASLDLDAPPTADEPPRPARDWTRGPAKWAAVIILAAAAIFGLAWSITQRTVPVVYGTRPAPESTTPAPPGTSTRTSTTTVTRDATTATPATATPAAADEPIDPHAPKPALTGTININTATAEELALLPGIGPALAKRIIEDREKNGPFETVEQLDRVKGIGPKKMEKLRPACRVN